MQSCRLAVVDSCSARRLSGAILKWKIACGVLAGALFAVFGWGLNEMRKNTDRQQITRADVLSAAERLASDSPDRLEMIFEAARRLEVEEAIPLAVMYAVKDDKKHGTTQFYVIAARRYLRDYDLDVIVQHVRRAAVSGAFKDADALLSKLPELMR